MFTAVCERCPHHFFELKMKVAVAHLCGCYRCMFASFTRSQMATIFCFSYFDEVGFLHLPPSSPFDLTFLSSGEPGSAVERLQGARETACRAGEGADSETSWGPGGQQGEVTDTSRNTQTYMRSEQSLALTLNPGLCVVCTRQADAFKSSSESEVCFFSAPEDDHYPTEAGGWGSRGTPLPRPWTWRSGLPARESRTTG